MKSKDIIKEILEEDESTRDNNALLIKKVYERYGYDLKLEPIGEFNIPIQHLPSFATVSRTKRTVQEENHKLMPNPEFAKTKKRERQIEVKLKRPEVHTEDGITFKYSRNIPQVTITDQQKIKLNLMHNELVKGSIIKTKEPSEHRGGVRI